MDHLEVSGELGMPKAFANARNTSEQRVTRRAHGVSGEQRSARNGHLGAVVWLTGLSGSGKSTLAMALEAALFARGCFVYVLDGDNLRLGLNADLGFSPEDRAENVRRVGEVAALFADAGAVCIVALISPYLADRARARAAAARGKFIEVHLTADLATCEKRDPRGLYQMARSGKVKSFTGIDAPYEIPESPELRIDTAKEPLETSLERLLSRVLEGICTTETRL